MQFLANGIQEARARCSFASMDSLALAAASIPLPPAQLPAWASPRGRDMTGADAAFAAGIALKSLDDLVRSLAAWPAAGAPARH